MANMAAKVMAGLPLFFAIFSLLPSFSLPEDVLGTTTDDFDFDGLPGVQHEFKVEVLAGKEECFYQAIKQGAQLHVSFEVLKGGDRLVNFFVRDQNGMLIEHRPFTTSGQTNTQVHFGGLLEFFPSCQVLRGADRNIDFLIKDSKNGVLDSHLWTSTGSTDKEIKKDGVYGFCIDNTFSRFSAKLVYFYLVTYVVAEWELFTQELQEIDLSVENSTNSLKIVDKNINAMLRMQAVGRQHVVTDWYLIHNNNIYIQRLSILMICIICGSGGLQVYFVRRLFRTKEVTPTSKPRA